MTLSDRPGGLAAALVRRPVTVLMLFLTIIGAGLLSYMRIPLTLLPRGLSSSSLTVSLPYPGAGPQEVADQLTRPVEETLRTIPGVNEIFSVSSEGQSRVTVEFGVATDMDVAYGEVRDRVERIRAQLPPEMDRYRIRRWNSNTDMPVMWMGVQYEPDMDDPFGPIERIVVPRLEGVDGVARANTMGIVDEAIRVFVDVPKVAGYGIDLGDVIRQMQADNFTLPAGRIDDAGRTFALRIDARFQTIEDIERYPVGNGLVLADIADIQRGRGYRDWVWRINGEGAVGISVSRESDQNTIELCDRLEETVAKLGEDPRLEGITLNIFWSQKESIMDAISGLQSSAMWGGLFAVLILFFFLRDMRMTLLAALAIPSSLLAAVMAVYFGGRTLNLISLAGFTLGIGMLVDNAVVVIENISRKRSGGAKRLDAAGLGAGEVGLAVLTATMTSIVVFLPLVFMDGDRNTKVMMAEVGLPISYSLAASLLVALVFLPTFTARLMRERGSAVADRQLSGRLVTSYRRSLRWILDHRFGATVWLGFVVMLAMTAGSNLKESNSGNDGGRGVEVSIDAPSTYSLSETNEVFSRYEEWAAEHQEEYGYDFYSTQFSRRGGSLQFYPRDDLDREREEAIPDLLRENLPELPGVEFEVGRGNMGANKELRVNIEGPDFGVLARIADDLRDQLAAIHVMEEGEVQPLLENVRTDLEQGLDEVHIRVDRDRASELGVDPQTVRGMVAWGLGGQRLPDLQEGDREVRVQIEYGKTEEESLEFLRNLGLYTNMGTVVPLASVADLDFDKSVGALIRRNGRTSTGITGVPTVENLYLVSREVNEVMRNYPFPEGYSWTEEGGHEELQNDLGELGRTLLFSVLLVYLLMAILLESVVLPLSILLSIPLALLGVNVTLFLTSRPMEVMVAVGMVLLAGIVVNNAIVLLDRVQRLRAQGLSRVDALIQGGSDRLRPILMTALTTICGLMPMANPGLFPGEGNSSGYESMATTVAGGLAFSTFFTLLAVPLFYTFFDDIGRIIRDFAPWKRPAEGGAAGPGSPSSEPVPMGPARDT